MCYLFDNIDIAALEFTEIFLAHLGFELGYVVDEGGLVVLEEINQISALLAAEKLFVEMFEFEDVLLVVQGLE